VVPNKPHLSRLPVWKKAIAEAAVPERAEDQLGEFTGTDAEASLAEAEADQARVWAAVFSGSIALSEQLRLHPDWMRRLNPEDLAHPRRVEGLRREVEGWVGKALKERDYAGAWRKLRLFKQREMCRIGARDLSRLSNASEITRELSDLADVCLSSALSLCQHSLEERLGRPYHRDEQGVWHPTEFTVVGLGKLGGQELNYSSDVDVMFVYAEEGHLFKTPPRKGARPPAGLASHQFLTRVAECYLAEVTKATAEGALYRMDLRLRPEGDSGPLVRSVGSCENYYAQWGQSWERMMLIKARCVAGDPELAEEFLEMVQSFRYPRHLSDRVLREMAAMKQRIENEVIRSGEIDRNVKLGRGGIRDIEFITQTRQILHAGRIPFLQGSQTLPTLRKLVQYQFLEEAQAEALTAAYLFLRDVEHRVQMEHNRQTHTIPDGAESQSRLARLMGFDNRKDFDKALKAHTRQVRRIYEEKIRFAEDTREASPYPQDLENDKERWLGILERHGFRDPAHSLGLLKELVQGPGYIHVSPRTSDLAWNLVPHLLKRCPGAGKLNAGLDPQRQVLSDPDRVLARLDSFISAYGARSMLFETWTHNLLYFELLILLFDRSEFLAETALRTPDLVDDLILSGRMNRSKTADETLADLRHGLRDEDQHVWIRKYHQAELMRIGLRDILGLTQFEQSLRELSHLADACLQYALDVVLRRHRIQKAPLTIIGLGKLGGVELNYGSDLDIVFIAPDATRNLPKLQRVASDLMDLLGARTEHGIVYEMDARLRPDGESGLLVNTLCSFEEYYRQRAQLWEIQALSRIRPLAGDRKLGVQFQELTGRLANFSPDNVKAGFRAPKSPRASGGKRRADSGGSGGLNAYTPDWKQTIARMRYRIETERTTPGRDAIAIKTGVGGLMDAEFIAQVLCLERGWQEANTLRALERVRDENALPRRDARLLIDHYRCLRRIEGILRRWSLEGESELPADPDAYRRVALRCGYSDAATFEKALAQGRREIRRVYNRVMPRPKTTEKT